jgi:gluconokinase
MSQGIPLTDADRAPWLEALHDRILESWQRRESLVVACSALKQKYREQLARGVVVSWVFLKGTADVIRARLQERPQHFMKAGMLESQLAALEEPKDAIVADVTLPPDAIVERIARALMTSVPG